MTDSAEERFVRELKAAQKDLEEMERPTDSLGMIEGGATLKGGLELPYSSLPKLPGRRWIKTEINA